MISSNNYTRTHVTQFSSSSDTQSNRKNCRKKRKIIIKESHYLVSPFQFVSTLRSLENVCIDEWHILISFISVASLFIFCFLMPFFFSLDCFSLCVCVYISLITQKIIIICCSIISDPSIKYFTSSMFRTFL